MKGKLVAFSSEQGGHTRSWVLVTRGIPVGKDNTKREREGEEEEEEEA